MVPQWYTEVEKYAQKNVRQFTCETLPRVKAETRRARRDAAHVCRRNNKGSSLATVQKMVSGRRQGLEMVKDAYWFRHDCNARNDTKMIKLRRLGGLEAVGLYWCVIESLREANAYQLPEFAIADFCFDLRAEEKVFRMLFDCDLLVLADGVFFSQSLNDRMLSLEEKREKLKKNGRKGGLAKAKQKLSNRQAKEKQLLSEKSRVDEIRVDEIRKVSETQALGPQGGNLPQKAPKEKKKKGRGVPVWNAYSEAYLKRYGVEPVRNAKANALCAKLVDSLGADEAPPVAAFYLTSGNQYHVSRGHSLNILLDDAEKVRMEWATGNRITQSKAQETDRLSEQGSVWARVKAKQGDQDGPKIN